MTIDTLTKMIGAVLAIVGITGVLFAIVAIVDPQGAQMANDNDPFGAPPKPGDLLVQIAVWSSILGAGIWLLLRQRAKSRVP